MAALTPFAIAIAVCTALLSAALILLGLKLLSRRDHARLAQFQAPPAERVIFLFNEMTLVDATPPAKTLLGSSDRDCPDLDRFVHLASPRFPELGARLKELGPAQRIEMDCAEAGPCGGLIAERSGTLTRIEILQNDGEQTLRSFKDAATAREIETLRAIAEDAPQLIWRQDRTGSIRWTNAAYLALADQIADVSGAWPPPVLFDQLAPVSSGKTPAQRRVSLRIEPEGEPLWFDVVALDRGEETLFIAEDAGPLVKAETAQRNFVQTLAKTFANLPTGLAIFDKDRNLVLFNPALHDLTGLPIDFLTAHPSLRSFLDRLRDARMLPEPKNYGTWRDAFTSMESAAVSGTYGEVWTLPNGQTYRVTGRPHPDGAVAFLIEDISAEISLTRRFRSQIDLGQAVIDAQSEALCVFSVTGRLTLSNAAFTKLFGIDEEYLTEPTVIDVTRTMQELALPTPAWGDLRDFIDIHSDRSEWSAPIQMLDGRSMELTCTPLGGGDTLCSFARRLSPVLETSETPALAAPDEPLEVAPDVPAEARANA
ncbi:PAS-domain containing protein [Aestuariibius insulae]|uniref:PAS-domain containing protein n=1 Tax=Aestuariibius insulae TaxID=2058287 RepID=UPI00345E9F9F